MDKYKLAFLAGILAGVILDATDAISFFMQKALNLKHIVYQDYMVAALLQGQPSKNAFEFICGQFFHLLFTGVIGCLYVVVLAFVKEKNSVFKGWLLGGVVMWFFCFMIGVLYKIDLFISAEMNTVLSDFITASIYGISLAVFYEYLVHRYHKDESEGEGHPR